MPFDSNILSVGNTILKNSAAEEDAKKAELTKEIEHTPSNPPVYELAKDYGSLSDQKYISVSPYWVIAVIRLGQPITFSRKDNKSNSSAVAGGYQRIDTPLVITDDCIGLSIESKKSSHVKSLSATLKHTDVNYLSANGLLPGDWVLAWIVNDKTSFDNLTQDIKNRKKCCGFDSGLKFVGRAHSIRKTVSADPTSGTKTATYSLQAIGFEEIDSLFYYNTGVAHSSVESDLRKWLGDVGVPLEKFLKDTIQAKAGQAQDNAGDLISFVFNAIVGEGFKGANIATDNAKNKLRAKNIIDAPYAYLVPRDVGLLLGLDTTEGTKTSTVFGYADICKTLIGLQKYTNLDKVTDVKKALFPDLDDKSTKSRMFTTESLKGTWIPVQPSFINKSLWSIISQFLNDAINEMYTTLKWDPRTESICPMLVVRQIPFSTEAAKETKVFPLTRFMSLPRWRIDPLMVWAFDVGRSNATRTNFTLITTDVSQVAEREDESRTMVRNHPIFDTTDMARSGVKGQLKTINCGVRDGLYGPRSWMSAIADWSFDSYLTLNGTMQCVGIQTPISEGDNIEFEGVVYHIEGITHECRIGNGGMKMFHTTLALSNGMPADQSSPYSNEYPNYPGIKYTGQVTYYEGDKVKHRQVSTSGEDSVVTSLDPGIIKE
jgi:hypothetical protein